MNIAITKTLDALSKTAPIKEARKKSEAKLNSILNKDILVGLGILYNTIQTSEVGTGKLLKFKINKYTVHATATYNINTSEIKNSVNIGWSF